MRHIKLFEGFLTEANDDVNVITKIELPSSGKIIKITTNGSRVENTERKPDYEGEATYTAKVLGGEKYSSNVEMQKAHRTLYALRELEIDGKPGYYDDSSFYGGNWYIHFTMERNENEDTNETH
jgi:hypothetical protein